MSLRHAGVCRLCASDRLVEAFSLSPMPWADDFSSDAATPVDMCPLTVCRCAACGHIQLREVWEAERIFRDYSSEVGSAAGLQRHCALLADLCLAHARGNDPLIFLDPLATKSGNQLALALETSTATKQPLVCLTPSVPTTPPARFADKPDFLDKKAMERLLAVHGPLDGVVAYHFVHNLEQLREFCQCVGNALKPDGVFSFESFYWGAVLENGGFDFLYHEHLSALHVTPLIPFFEGLGLELFDAQRTSAKGGSFCCHVQRRGAGRPATSALRELLREEQENGLAGGISLNAFQQRIAQAREDSRKRLHTLRSQGASVACYGASATTTALLSHFGIQDCFDLVVDDNPHKHGRWTPWRTARVMPAKKLRETHPDYIYVAAWRYADAIISRNSGHAENGGAWIIPLPTCTVVRHTR